MPLIHRIIKSWSVVLLGVVATLWSPASTRAGPIHSDVAFTPGKGGNIFRLQYSFSQSAGHGSEGIIHKSGVRATFVHGMTQNLSFFLTLRYFNRQADRILPRLGRVEDAHDGVGDPTFLIKYRFWQKDPHPGETHRWAVLGGLNIRGGDGHFTSDSYDPIIGTAFTFRRDRILWDADLIYQFNTGRGEFRHDRLRYDVACSYRLFPIEVRSDLHEFNAVAELNGTYATDGSHEVFFSPGIQFVTPQWVFETSIQLPVIQEFGDDRPRTDYRIVAGIKFQW